MSLSTISLVLVVAIIVSLIKPFLELKVGLTNPLHDTAVRLLAIAVGIIGSALDFAAHNGSWSNGQAIEALAGNGLVAGVGAVVTYHLLTGNVFDTFSGTTAVLSPIDTTPLKLSGQVPVSVTVPGVAQTIVTTNAPINPLPPDFKPYTPPTESAPPAATS